MTSREPSRRFMVADQSRRVSSWSESKTPLHRGT